MMPAMKPRGWPKLLLLVLAFAAHTQAEELTLAGRWSASTLRTNYTTDAWGPACGPRPMGESTAGGIVTISMAGSELNIVGLGRNYSTTTCWEGVPGQRVTSHGASKRAWRTTCQSAAGDSRRVTIATAISATDSRIDFSETGHFEFAIEGQICKASMSRSRSYSLVEREGDARATPEPGPAESARPPESTSVEPPERKPAERAVGVCATPGPAARLEVRPARKLLRAGDEFSFRVRVLDRAGCVVDRLPTWKLAEANTRLEVTPAGVIRVEKDAAEGTAVLTAAVQERSVQVSVDVVSESRYRELLSGGSFDDRGETSESAVANIASADVSAKTAVLDQSARNRRLVFVGVIGALAVCLAIAALWVGLGKRRGRRSPDSTLGGQGGGAAEAAGGGVCPICGQGFESGVTVCPVHDEELVPRAAAGTLPSVAPASVRRICPVCGTIYGNEHQFCGNDGAALVPIN